MVGSSNKMTVTRWSYMEIKGIIRVTVIKAHHA